MNRRTYGELGRRAALTIAAGQSVVVDATCRHRTDRDALIEGLPDAADVWFVECVAPAEVRLARAAARERDPRRVSDATADLVRRQHDAFETIDEVRPDHHAALRTDRPTLAVLTDLLALLHARLANAPDDRSSQSRG